MTTISCKECSTCGNWNKTTDEGLKNKLAEQVSNPSNWGRCIESKVVNVALENVETTITEKLVKIVRIGVIHDEDGNPEGIDLVFTNEHFGKRCPFFKGL